MVDAAHCRRLGWIGLGNALARSIHALFNAARAIYGDLLCFNHFYYQYRLAEPGIGSVWSLLRRVVIIGILVFTFAAELSSSQMLFRVRFRQEAVVLPTGRGVIDCLTMTVCGAIGEQAGAWIKAHAPPDAIVSTSAPHFFYLRTGLRAILPPMEAAPERARQLLESVPVSYVIVDKLKFVDISRRYADPAVESDRGTWRVVQSMHGTRFMNAEAPRNDSFIKLG